MAVQALPDTGAANGMSNWDTFEVLCVRFLLPHDLCNVVGKKAMEAKGVGGNADVMFCCQSPFGMADVAGVVSLVVVRDRC